MRKCLKTLLLLIVVLMPLSCNSAPEQKGPDMEWWREARFGMFIHWGLYAVSAGEWNGEQVPFLSSWIQNTAHIPSAEYDKLAEGLTLENYNPEEWVKMAKDAGCGYIVYTTKHHDGFAMYRSSVSDFDIRRTGYEGDPLKELIDACHKYGIRVGLYYSHRQDWHEEAAAYLKDDFDGHFGKPKSEVKVDFDKYMEEKAIPQVRELLTNYGQIDVLWYDTPLDMTREQSERFVQVVRELQPQCIINGRVGYDLGDYGPLGDNELPCAAAVQDLEMVATMNHTWGYKKNDHSWKKPKDLLCSLIECSSRGVNYMLNIGPMADGTVPQPSVDIMAYIAKWMSANSESVYGTFANPFNDNFPWGLATCKGRTLYFQMYSSPDNLRIRLKGLAGKAVSAQILSTGQDVMVSEIDGDFVLTLPEGLDYDSVPVVKLVMDRDVAVEKINYAHDGIIRIPVSSGSIVPGEGGSLRFAEGRYTDNFNDETGKLILNCLVETPGTYMVRLYTSRHWRRTFPKGAVVSLVVDGNEYPGLPLVQDGELANVRQKSYPESWTDLVKVSFDTAGEKTIEISVDNPGSYVPLTRAGEDTMNLESDKNVRMIRMELISL